MDTLRHGLCAKVALHAAHMAQVKLPSYPLLKDRLNARPGLLVVRRFSFGASQRRCRSQAALSRHLVQAMSLS